MNIVISSDHQFDIFFSQPPARKTDPQIDSYHKWLEKVSQVADPGTSWTIGYIKLMTVNWMPACYLLLGEESEPIPALTGGEAPVILDTALAVGTTFSLPEAYGKLSRSDLQARLAEETITYLHARESDAACLFHKAVKLVVGRGDEETTEVRFRKI